ncbi:MAG TPA: fatty acid desaturase family protein [Myxococcota bacterium]|jgi:fatty acid desaturase
MGEARAWRSAITPEELESLLARSDWRSALSIAFDWALVFASFALVAAASGPLTLGLSLLVALFVIGGRQLGFAVLMHEAAHRTLFANRRLNDFAGNWLCAYPIWADLAPYRNYHLKHHAKNWTAEDPDLGLATKFPVTRASLRRKIVRDLSGRVGWKRVKAVLARDLGPSGPGWKNLRGVVITNALLLGILAVAGHPELYLVWVAAWFTTNSLATRIRSIAEHNMVPDPSDELRNTRTTLASWWERLLLAPNRVNFHLEHHLLMTVPFYNLPRLHRLLRERGALDGALIEPGYLGLLRRAGGKPA